MLFFVIKYFNYLIKIPSISLYNRFFLWPFKFNFYKQFKDVDVFHVHFAHDSFDLPLLKSIGFLKGRLITTFHGYDAHYSQEKELKNLQSKYKLLFKYGDAFTVNTSYLKDKVLKLGCCEEILHTIPMGVDVQFFKTSQEKFLSEDIAIQLLSVGRLIPLKGHAFALESVKLLKAKGYNIKYTIIGEGELNSNLKQKVKDLELEDQVQLVGKKTQQEIKVFFMKSHVFLMSSVADNTGRQEAQGIVTIEAQAMGLPVVAFDSGGVSSTILNGKTGFLVKEKDVMGYANAIQLLVSNPSVYSQMGMNAREWAVKHFSNDVVNKLFFSLYDS